MARNRASSGASADAAAADAAPGPDWTRHGLLDLGEAGSAVRFGAPGGAARARVVLDAAHFGVPAAAVSVLGGNDVEVLVEARGPYLTVPVDAGVGGVRVEVVRAGGDGADRGARLTVEFLPRV